MRDVYAHTYTDLSSTPREKLVDTLRTTVIKLPVHTYTRIGQPGFSVNMTDDARVSEVLGLCTRARDRG